MTRSSGNLEKSDDLKGEHYRTKVERNVARILNFLQYEFERHKAIDIRCLAKKYNFRKTETGRLLQEVQPDFYLPECDTYIEVKTSGMDRNDRQRIAAVLLHCESYRLELIMPITYKILEQILKDKIPNWES